MSRSLLIPVVGVVVTALLLAAGAVVLVLGQQVPRGTRVLGIDVGGRTRVEAAEVLRTDLNTRLSAPVEVRAGPVTTKLSPDQVGLGVDVNQTIDRAATGRPKLFGHRDVDPVITVDAGAVANALKDPATRVTTSVTQPQIRFDGLTPVPVYAKPGRGLDLDATVAALRAGWLRQPAIDAPLKDIVPATSNAEVDRLVRELAQPAVAAPVKVRTPDATFTVSPAAIAASLVLVGDDQGVIKPHLDEQRLRAAIAGELAKVETQPQEAHVSVGSGEPVAVDGTGGKTVDLAALVDGITGVLAAPAPRTVTAKMITTEPKSSGDSLTQLGVKEKISTFTTRFNGGEERNKNIITVAKKVDGAVVKPGETFSLNGYTGERGYAQGYVDAPVILDGKLVNAVGGGISQFTTTLFNASYYAGLRDVEHQPHSFYISRYPSVIESTIYWPSLDLKFKNDSPYGVLIDTSYTNSSITVSMWSTKRYDISTEWSPRRDVVEPKTEYLGTAPGCIATEGSQGFTQDAWRIFRLDGKEVKREKFSWRYDAEPHFVCADPPK